MQPAAIKSVLGLMFLGISVSANAQESFTRTIYREGQEESKKTASFTSGSWSRQHPAYNLFSINSLFFLNSQTGWAASGSTANQICSTRDGARNWQLHSGPEDVKEDAYWHSVYFANETQGWAVGGNKVIHSSDRGQTWNEQKSPLPESSRLRKVFFSDQVNGWSVGDQGAVIQTKDGGLSWNQVHTGYSGDFSDVCFVGNLIGWIVGLDRDQTGLILKTADGGRTWTKQVSNPDKKWTSVHFTDLSTGWIAGAGCILKTENAGADWKMIYPATTGTHEYSQIRLQNSSYGWCLDQIWGKGRIIRTTDGGKSWIDLTPAGINDIDHVFFVSTATGWISNSEGLFMKTTNGGLTWINLASLTNNRFWDLQPMDNYHVWAAGAKETVVQTANSGSNWDLGFTPVAESKDFYAITFPDSRHGWMCYGKFGKIWKTSDGGKTWDDRLRVPTDLALHDLIFLDANIGFAFGGNVDNRMIYKSFNGGASWKKVSYPDGDAIMHAFFIDEIVGWATCLDGSILKTTDRGEHWAVISSHTEHWLEKILFLNRELGFIVGQGIILRTHDGGETWQSLGSYQGWVEDICFMDSIHGIAVGGGFSDNATMSKTIDMDGNLSTTGGVAKIWITNDGGNTWASQTITQAGWLLACGFTDLNSAWATGNSGTIIKYSNTFDIPDQPTDLEGVATSATTVRLTWKDESDNEDGFIIYRRNGLSGPFREVAKVSAGTEVYRDQRLTPGESYWYYIAAYNSTGTSSKTIDISVQAIVSGLESFNNEFVDDLRVFPNPLTSDSRLAYAVIQSGRITISLVDLAGRVVYPIQDQWINSGDHSLSLNFQGISPGVYGIRLTTRDGTKTVRCILQ